MYYLSADVGGTFTDLILVDGETNQVFLDKVSSKKRGSAGSIRIGIERITEKAGCSVSDIGLFVHGCTVATNAFLMRNGADTAMVVTKGFRDVLHIAKQLRPHLYSLEQQKPATVIPRSRIFEVEERVDAHGNVVQPLSEETIGTVVGSLAQLDPPSVAVCLNFSHENAIHEIQLYEVLRQALPNTLIYLSSVVNPQIEEYPRANTTAIAAYVGPILDGYIHELEMDLKEQNIEAPLLLFRSDGGVATPRTARENPASQLLSGPAGGVIAAEQLSGALGIPNLITIDVGGTSADFSAIVNGKARVVSERVIDWQPVRQPSADIGTISSGGGSIAWIDRGGALRVGPDSAGAVPGPACYGMGGVRPTVTDAAVVLGYLGVNSYLGGEMTLNADLALMAITKDIAEPLGLSVEAAALGILSIANIDMAQAIRTLAVERGLDIRQFSLLAFGGAGPLYSSQLMRTLNMTEVVVPRTPGVFSALGLLMSDIRHSTQLPFSVNLENAVEQGICNRLGELRSQLEKQLESDGVISGDRYYQYSGDLRCVGQFHEISIPFAALYEGELWDVDQVAALFHNEHHRIYGHSDPDVPVEIVNIRVDGYGHLSSPDMAFSKDFESQETCSGSRSVIFDVEVGYVDTPVYQRSKLPHGCSINGPAIIEQMDSTTVVLPGQKVEVIANGNMRVAEIEE